MIIDDVERHDYLLD
jgi:hypothetical protein